MHSATFPVYSASDVERLLSADACFAAVREAMRALTAGGVEQPLRTITQVGSGLLGLMPGVAQTEVGFGAKLVSLFGDPSTPGRTAHRGVVVLFDAHSGMVRCVAEAGAITEIRTAAASAVATDALARGNSRVLAIFGTGHQARSHAIAVSRVRNFESIVIWGRDAERAAALKDALRERLDLRVECTTDGQAAAAVADVICTVTSASRPILRRSWVRPGTHVNVVGSSFLGPTEVDSELVRDSRYIADYRRSALAAAAEFAIAKQAGMVDDSHIAGEIGEVLLGRIVGRRNDAEITFYKSLGHIVQDLAAVDCVHRAAGGARG